MLVSLQNVDSDEHKLVILNLDTGEERVVIEPNSASYFFDMQKIPCGPNLPLHFLLHTGKGIQIVNAEKGKAYDLADNYTEGFNVCRSLQVVPIDPEDYEMGFWLTQIDIGRDR